MKERIQRFFLDSIAVKEGTLEDNADAILKAVEVITASLSKGNKVFLFGNGGSAADSQHIAAEFVGRFKKERASWPAIALTTDSSALTAIGNDYGFENIFSRQLEGLGKEGDVAIGISTSGNSTNVIKAIELAKTKKIRTIALTGEGGGKLGPLADIKIIVPSKDTARIQEAHICVSHCLCELVEENLTAKH